MPLQRITFDMVGEAQYDRAFRVLASEAQDLTEPLTDARDILIQSTGEQFGSEGAHGLGGRWKALSHPYAEQKEERWGMRPILVASGELRNAILTRGTIELGPRRLVWGVPPGARYPDGTSVEQVAGVHQKGEGNVPARKIIAMPAADRRRIDRAFVEYFQYIRRRAGFLNRTPGATG